MGKTMRDFESLHVNNQLATGHCIVQEYTRRMNYVRSTAAVLWQYHINRNRNASSLTENPRSTL